MPRALEGAISLERLLWSRLVIASKTTPLGGTKEEKDDHQDTNDNHCSAAHDEQLAQLQPFTTGLDITATVTQRLAMRAEVYDALAERVGDALDYDIRWQPNEYEPDSFVERVRPLELTNGMLAWAGNLPAV